MKQKEAISAGNNFAEKNVREFGGSVFNRIGTEWMLITAGDISADKSNWNTMTAAWGGLGVLWRKDVAFTFVRPSRHTFDFTEKLDVFTLSFFGEGYREALNLCGTKSGRDIDKAGEAGLTPIYFSGGACDGAVSFKEAVGTIICKKIYTHDLDHSRFLDSEIEKNYNGADYHRMYIGEIIGYKTPS
ncbi:MAG: flavin reductase [Treponema sp.]|nr:flavin reductase [Treponema sp.]